MPIVGGLFDENFKPRTALLKKHLWPSLKFSAGINRLSFGIPVLVVMIHKKKNIPSSAMP